MYVFISFPIYANDGSSIQQYITQAVSLLPATSPELTTRVDSKGKYASKSVSRPTGRRTMHSQLSSSSTPIVYKVSSTGSKDGSLLWPLWHEGLVELASSSEIISNGHSLFSAGRFWNLFLLCNMPSSPCNILTT